jgi:hypothetical protein
MPTNKTSPKLNKAVDHGKQTAQLEMFTPSALKCPRAPQHERRPCNLIPLLDHNRTRCQRETFSARQVEERLHLGMGPPVLPSSSSQIRLVHPWLGLCAARRQAPADSRAIGGTRQRGAPLHSPSGWWSASGGGLVQVGPPREGGQLANGHGPSKAVGLEGVAAQPGRGKTCNKARGGGAHFGAAPARLHRLHRDATCVNGMLT